MDDLVNPPKSSNAGCLVAAVLTSLFALSSCVVGVSLIFGDAVETKDRAEFFSPDHRYVAILHERWQSGFLGTSTWVDLAVKRLGSLEEAEVGIVGYKTRPDVKWLSERSLLITVLYPWPLDIKTSVEGLDIKLRIADELRAREYHMALEQQERDGRFNGPEGCSNIYANWEAARKFYAWSRRFAENGEPDPGPWVGTTSPVDCATLRPR